MRVRFPPPAPFPYHHGIRQQAESHAAHFPLNGTTRSSCFQVIAPCVPGPAVKASWVTLSAGAFDSIPGNFLHFSTNNQHLLIPFLSREDQCPITESCRGSSGKRPVLWAIGTALPAGMEAKGAQRFIEQWWHRQNIVWPRSVLDDRPRPPRCKRRCPLRVPRAGGRVGAIPEPTSGWTKPWGQTRVRRNPSAPWGRSGPSGPSPFCGRRRPAWTYLRRMGVAER